MGDGLTLGAGLELLSGLLNTTSGVLEVLAGGWPLIEILALFTLWASASTPLQEKDNSEWAAPLEKKREGGEKAELTLPPPPPPLTFSSSSLG